MLKFIIIIIQVLLVGRYLLNCQISAFLNDARIARHARCPRAKHGNRRTSIPRDRRVGLRGGRSSAKDGEFPKKVKKRIERSFLLGARLFSRSRGPVSSAHSPHTAHDRCQSLAIWKTDSVRQKKEGARGEIETKKRNKSRAIIIIVSSWSLGIREDHGDRDQLKIGESIPDFRRCRHAESWRGENEAWFYF